MVVREQTLIQLGILHLALVLVVLLEEVAAVEVMMGMEMAVLEALVVAEMEEETVNLPQTEQPILAVVLVESIT
jgi:hypothetical protein